MRLRRRSVLKFMSYGAAGMAAVGLRPRTASAKKSTLIERDVCVIGGGSSGTFTAVSLRDAGKSVVVLERKQRMGGHTETFNDPTTHIPVDIGVEVLHDLPVVNDYFARFGVPLLAISTGSLGGQQANVDFRTGHVPSNYNPPSQAEVNQALGFYFGYLQQLKATYYDLDSGFDLPTPIPPDLLLPFADFVTKYSLGALVPTAFAFGQGLGNILSMPTVYVLKLFSAQVLSSLFAGKFLLCPTGNSTIYEKATQFLGEDVVFGAEVERVQRHAKGVTVHVNTPDGRVVIQAKKLVVTCPPTLSNLRNFDLDGLEAWTFGRWRSNFYWTGLLRLEGVPAGLTVANVGRDTLYNLPPLPGTYGLNPTPVPGLWKVKYGSGEFVEDCEVQERIVNDVRRLSDPTFFPHHPKVLEFTEFSAHVPFEMRVSSQEIANGFYTTLGSLQGRNHTYYNGAAFHVHDSSLLWQFSKNHVLPMILT